MCQSTGSKTRSGVEETVSKTGWATLGLRLEGRQGSALLDFQNPAEEE